MNKFKLFLFYFTFILVSATVLAAVEIPPSAPPALPGNTAQNNNIQPSSSQILSFIDKNPKDPSVPDKLMELGYRYLTDDRPAEAAIAFLRLFKQFQNHSLASNALLEAAGATEETGRISDAADLYELFLDKFKNDPAVTSVRPKLSVLYEKLGRPDDAVNALKTVIKSTPPALSAIYIKSLVELYFRIDRNYEAQTLIEQYLKTNPGDSQFLVSLSQTYERDKNYDDAISIYENLLKSNPGNSYFETSLFSALKYAGKLETKIETLELQKKKKPGDMAPVRILCRLFLWDKRSLEALAQFEIIVAREPNNISDAVTLARLYYENQWANKAKLTLQKILDRIPDYEPALRELGNIYYQENEREKAREAWELAAKFNPADEQSYRRLSGYLYNYHLYAEVAAIFEQGREKIGNPNVFANDLANLYYVQFQFVKALEEYIKLIIINPGDKQFSDKTLELASKSEIVDKGLLLIKNAIAAHPENPELINTYIEVLLETNKKEEAFKIAADASANPLFADNFYAGLAMRRMMRGEHAQSAELFDIGASSAREDRNFCLLEAGREWLSANDPDRAAVDYRLLADQTPSAPGADEAMLKLAEISEDKNNSSDARNWYSRLVSEFPTSVWYEPALLGEARATFFFGDFSAAKNSLDALYQRPGASKYFSEILFYRAETRLLSSNPEEAEKLYRQLIDQYPESAFVKDSIARLLFLADTRDADSIQVQALLSAEKKSLQGKYPEAESTLRGLILTLPPGILSDHANVNLASLLIKQKKNEEAAFVLTTFFDSRKDSNLHARSGAILAEILLQLGRKDEALKRCQEVITAHPESYWARRARAIARSINPS